MNEAATEVLGSKLAKNVAQRAEALEVLRSGVRPLATAQLISGAICAGIGGAVAGHFGGVAYGEILGLAVGCSLSLGLSSAMECLRIRKRLEAAIVVLLQEVQDGA